MNCTAIPTEARPHMIIVARAPKAGSGVRSPGFSRLHAR